MGQLDELESDEVPTYWKRCVISNIKDPIKSRDIIKFHLNTPMSQCLWHLLWAQEDLQVIFE